MSYFDETICEFWHNGEAEQDAREHQAERIGDRQREEDAKHSELFTHKQTSPGA